MSGDPLDDFPRLELRHRPALLNADDLTFLVRIRLVVRVIVLRPAHGLLEQRMRETALDADDHGLVRLVAHHHALEDALWHSSLLNLPSACGDPPSRCGSEPRRAALHERERYSRADPSRVGNAG